jgi:hypothetical protein
MLIVEEHGSVGDEHSEGLRVHEMGFGFVGFKGPRKYKRV